MIAALLMAIHDALKADPESARCELMAMGVRPSAINRLAALHAKDVPTLAALNVVQISIDYEALAGLHTAEELSEIFLQRGATNELLERVLGLTQREIALQRAVVGIAATAGRPAGIDEVSTAKVLELNRTLGHLPFAERLLAVHDRMPMWPLASIWQVIRT